MPSNVGEVLKKRPKQWGLRGDPFLWDELEAHFSSIERPLSVDEFEKEVIKMIGIFAGKDIKENRFIYVQRYDHGGMSGGAVCQEFWLNKALPILIERYRIFAEEMEVHI